MHVSCYLAAACLLMQGARGFGPTPALHAQGARRCLALRRAVESGGEESTASAENDVIAAAAAAARPTRVKRQSVNERLATDIVKAAGQEDLEKLAEDQLAADEAATGRFERTPVDLNGTNPGQAALGSGMAALLSFVAWRFTSFAMDAYGRLGKEDESALYISQRLGSIMKQVVIGLGSLATGVFGVISLGLLLLAGRVAVGLAQGELTLDPVIDETESKKDRGLADVEEAIRKAQEGM